MHILSIIPPMTQLNTPYPSTAYLTGFLRSRGFDRSVANRYPNWEAEAQLADARFNETQSLPIRTTGGGFKFPRQITHCLLQATSRVATLSQCLRLSYLELSGPASGPWW